VASPALAKLCVRLHPMLSFEEPDRMPAVPTDRAEPTPGPPPAMQQEKKATNPAVPGKKQPGVDALGRQTSESTSGKQQDRSQDEGQIGPAKRSGSG